jgi:hypothetical protein
LFVKFKTREGEKDRGYERPKVKKRPTFHFVHRPTLAVASFVHRLVHKHLIKDVNREPFTVNRQIQDNVVRGTLWVVRKFKNTKPLICALRRRRICCLRDSRICMPGEGMDMRFADKTIKGGFRV